MFLLDAAYPIAKFFRGTASSDRGKVRRIGETPAGRTLPDRGDSGFNFIQKGDGLFKEARIEIVIDLLVEFGTGLRVVSDCLHGSRG